MVFFLRVLRLVCLALWVGGIAFFAFVVAPVAFHGLASTHEAGIVVRGSLLVLHRIGLVCGVMLACAAFLLRRFSGSLGRTNLAFQVILACLMFATTLVSARYVLPAMEMDRTASGGVIDRASRDDPRRIHFERLHVLSERLEGTVLLLGLGIALLMADEVTGE